MRKIIFEVDITAKVKKGGDHYVYCRPAINIYSKGKTKDKALINLKSNVNQFIAACYKKGYFDKLIKNNRSYRQNHPHPIP